jgi:hypothetical protein
VPPGPDGSTVGNEDRELGALVGLADDLDAALVGVDDGADEAEAEAETALGTAFVAAIEAVPDAVLFRDRNAHAVVAEADYEVSVFGAGLDGHLATGGGVLEGVVEQVGEDLAQARGIDQALAGREKSLVTLMFFSSATY